MHVEARGYSRWRFAPPDRAVIGARPPENDENLDLRRHVWLRHRTCNPACTMKMHTNTGVDDREQWRARIKRALQELQGEDGVSVGRLRRDATTDDAAAESPKL